MSRSSCWQSDLPWREPADGQVERYAGFVVEQRHEYKMGGDGLVDHRVWRATLEEVEQHGLQCLRVDTVFFNEKPHRGLETVRFSPINSCEVLAYVRRQSQATHSEACLPVV